MDRRGAREGTTGPGAGLPATPPRLNRLLRDRTVITGPAPDAWGMPSRAEHDSGAGGPPDAVHKRPAATVERVREATYGFAVAVVSADGWRHVPS